MQKILVVIFTSVIANLSAGCVSNGPSDVIRLDALADAQWEVVYQHLQSTEPASEDSTAKLVKAHAALATNKNNESLKLFMASASGADISEWDTWTASFLVQHPGNVVAHYLRGDAFARNQQFDQAIAEFTNAISIDPHDALSLHALGTIYAARRDWYRALEAFGQAAAVASNLAEAYSSLGATLVNLGESPNEARNFYNLALQNSPHYVLALNGRASTQFALGNLDAAIVDLDKAQEQGVLRALAISNLLITAERRQEFMLRIGNKQTDIRPGTSVEVITAHVDSLSAAQAHTEKLRATHNQVVSGQMQTLGQQMMKMSNSDGPKGFFARGFGNAVREINRGVAVSIIRLVVLVTGITEEILEKEKIHIEQELKNQETEKQPSSGKKSEVGSGGGKKKKKQNNKKKSKKLSKAELKKRRKQSREERRKRKKKPNKSKGNKKNKSDTRVASQSNAPRKMDQEYIDSPEGQAEIQRMQQWLKDNLSKWRTKTGKRYIQVLKELGLWDDEDDTPSPSAGADPVDSPPAKPESTPNSGVSGKAVRETGVGNDLSVTGIPDQAPNDGLLITPIHEPGPNEGLLITPIPEPDPNDGILITPVPEPDPNDGILITPIVEPDARPITIIPMPGFLPPITRSDDSPGNSHGYIAIQDESIQVLVSVPLPAEPNGWDRTVNLQEYLASVGGSLSAEANAAQDFYGKYVQQLNTKDVGGVTTDGAELARYDNGIWLSTVYGLLYPVEESQ